MTNEDYYKANKIKKEINELNKAKNDLAPVAARLEELLGQKVKFIPETRGKALEDAVKAIVFFIFRYMLLKLSCWFLGRLVYRSHTETPTIEL